MKLLFEFKLCPLIAPAEIESVSLLFYDGHRSKLGVIFQEPNHLLMA